jgi:hypothetical protein
MSQMRTSLPPFRGPITNALYAGWATGSWAEVELSGVDAAVDDDLHLALWCCYQLHYGGFHQVPDDLEWDGATLEFRLRLEAAFEAALRAEHHPDGLPEDPVVAVRLIDAWSGPPLAATVADVGTRGQVSEFVVHRSAYQLKEADAHTWGIPRLAGRTKAAFVEIQADEYGGGRPGQAHADLFAAAMGELALDPTFGAYVDRLPGVTLATDNLVSMFGLHHRLRGALVGHLAHFELSSPRPMARYLKAASRLGLPALARFYEVHVAADAHHGQLALDGAVGPLVAAEPELAADVIFGAASLHRVEARFARHLVAAWQDGISSLRPPTTSGRRSGARTPTLAT